MRVHPMRVSNMNAQESIWESSWNEMGKHEKIQLGNVRIQFSMGKHEKTLGFGFHESSRFRTIETSSILGEQHLINFSIAPKSERITK